jgi:hypothetical protein
MPPLEPNKRRVAGLASLTCSVAITAILTFASVPAGAQSVGPAPTATAAACPVLSLANPGPGDKISEGGLVVSGTAYDPAATSGSGIARVDLFLGLRDNGGIGLGSAVPGVGGNPRAFSLTVDLPDTDSTTVFAAYAISAITGQETTVSFPLFVGSPVKSFGATPTPIPNTQTITTTCPRQAQAASTAPGASASTTPVASATGVGAPSTTLASSSRGCPVLSLANPGPGDKISEGGLVVFGTAYDPAATSDSGIARVDLFLGFRDNGGIALGSAVPGVRVGGNPRAFSLTVDLPDTDSTTVFAAYAISAITGQETVVSFPLFVGSPVRSFGATPTPIPSTLTLTSTCRA